MSKQQSKLRQSNRRLPLIIFPMMLIILVVIFLIIFRQRNNNAADKSLTIQPAASLAVPESSASAKTYIDRASIEADKNNYQKAIEILNEGLQKYPDDQNLQLTKEYYENQAQNNEQ